MNPKRPWYRLTLRRAMVLVVVSALGATLVRAVYSAREEARRAGCVNQLKMIGLALHSYYSAHECFPSARVNGPDGKPWHSWRILISPYLEQHDPLRSPYHFDEPWNGPRNGRWIYPFSIFNCPADHAAPSINTNYVLIVGPGTAFPGAGTTKISDVRDGMNHTIAVVECTGLDIPWTEPRDLDLSQLSFLLNDPKRPGPSSQHPSGVNVLFLDGSVTTLKLNVTPAQLKAMLTINGHDDPGPQAKR